MPAQTPARPFGAVLTAMVTPMRIDGEVDIDAAVRLSAIMDAAYRAERSGREEKVAG